VLLSISPGIVSWLRAKLRGKQAGAVSVEAQ
jgi:hypothetical protein